jgi:sulfatase maturation enzyme AslB (radical SAM superfamily)
VSLDLVEGTRLTLGGRASEDRVVRNLELLREHDIGMGAIVVLAAHTSNHVIDIYDYFESLRMPVRFLPLFQSPRSGESGIHISDAGIQAALRRVFMHWVDRPAPVHVSPLLDHVYTVLLSLRGESQPPYDRRISGEWALLVNTDGELYQRIDAYERERSLGNVFVEDIESIINSERYAASLDRDDVLWNRYCKGCEFDGPCTSMDVFESPRPDLGAKRCAISYRLNQFILRHFVSRFEDPAAGAGAFIGLCNASTRRSADAKALVG